MESERALNRMVASSDAQIQRSREIPNPLGEGTVALGDNDRTLPQLRSNAHLEDLFFGKYLHAQDPNMAVSIAQKIENDPARSVAERLFTDEENAFLEASRQGFNRQMTLVSLAREAISDPEIQRMALRDPRIQEVLGQTRNLQEAGNVLRSQLDKMAVENPRGFETLVDNLRSARTLGSSPDAERATANVLGALGRHGITEEAYRTAIEPALGTAGMTDAVRENLAQLARAQMNGIGRLWDGLWGGGHVRRKVAQIERAFEGERAIMQRRDAYMGQVGTILRGTLDPDMRIAIIEALKTGNAPVLREERAVKTFAEFRGVREGLRESNSPEARQRRYKERLQAECVRLGKTPDAFTQPEHDAFDASCLSEETAMQQGQREQHKATGLFAALMELLWPTRDRMHQDMNGWWATASAPL